MIPILLSLLMQVAPVYGPTESYVVAVYAKGTAPPAAPLAVIATFPLASLACDRAPSLILPGILLADPTIGLEFADPDRVGRSCITAPLTLTAAIPLCVAAPCPVYDVFLQAINRGGSAWSPAAIPGFTVRAVPNPLPPECLAPLGSQALAVFPTNVQRTAQGKPGSKARINYQLASLSPVVTITWRIDGVVAAALKGEALTDTAGLWFVMPASGTHPTSLAATNSYGCSREVAGPGLLVP